MIKSGSKVQWFNEWETTTWFGGRQCTISDLMEVYHSETRMIGGESVLILDIGSVGNLAGSEWCVSQGRKCLENNRQPKQDRRNKPLNVSGVGKGAQRCDFNCKLPVALPRKADGPLGAEYETPVIPNSALPALIGLATMRETRTVLDVTENNWYMCGPGNYNLMEALPPGTDCSELCYTPSGHMAVRCDLFTDYDKRKNTGGIKVEKAVALPVSGAASSSAASSL